MRARNLNTNRQGYTILELLVVMAALLILGTFVLPTIFSMRGDTHSKAGVDMIRSRINEGRTKAMEDGTAYRLAFSTDQKRMRLSPDTYQSAGASTGTANGTAIIEDDFPESVTAGVLISEEDQMMQDDEGWIRVATFLPDGTCREDMIEIEIREPGVAPYVIRLRGLTGAVTVIRGVLEAAQ